MIDLSAFPKTRKLKDGKEIIIRSLEKTDEDKLLRFMKALPTDERMYFRDDVTDPAVIHKWVYETDTSQVIPLVATYNGELISSWSLHLTDLFWTRHLAHIRGIVAPEYRGYRISSKMVYELLTIAGDLNIERVVIELAAQQKRLLARFTNIGFQLEAVLKDWAKDHSGQYNDLLILTMKLEPAWKKLEELILDYETHGG
ncbi:MAG: GNAT family N-acetyltransferase [Candidatus Hatepunaea meridiana]|nr:GNAT family N-acetyltransferase [Candidatus Hatepunaea meridiana]